MARISTEKTTVYNSLPLKTKGRIGFIMRNCQPPTADDEYLARAAFHSSGRKVYFFITEADKKGLHDFPLDYEQRKDYLHAALRNTIHPHTELDWKINITPMPCIGMTKKEQTRMIYHYLVNETGEMEFNYFGYEDEKEVVKVLLPYELVPFVSTARTHVRRDHDEIDGKSLIHLANAFRFIKGEVRTQLLAAVKNLIGLPEMTDYNAEVLMGRLKYPFDRRLNVISNRVNLNDDVGTFFAAMNPPHRGHLEMIKKMLAEQERVVVAITSADKSRTAQNPFTYEERLQMLNSMLEEHLTKEDRAKITIFPLRDWWSPRNDKTTFGWSVFLYYNLVMRAKVQKVTYYCLPNKKTAYSRDLRFIIRHDRSVLSGAVSRIKVKGVYLPQEAMDIDTETIHNSLYAIGTVSDDDIKDKLISDYMKLVPVSPLDIPKIKEYAKIFADIRSNIVIKTTKK